MFLLLSPSQAAASTAYPSCTQCIKEYSNRSTARPRCSKLLISLLMLSALTEHRGRHIPNGTSTTLCRKDHLFAYICMVSRILCLAGMSYHMDFEEEANVRPEDMVMEYDGGFKLVCDPKSGLYLFGMRLDYSGALIGGGFQFHNPNAASSCGCGKSFGV